MDLRATAVFSLMMATPIAATAGVNTWSSVGPAGGEVIKVAYNRNTPTTLYMIAGAGFLRSLDEGATWQLVTSDFFYAFSDLDVDPTDPNRVYVVSPTSLALQVSTDAGATFTPTASFPNIGGISQLEVGADGDTLYAASGFRVFRSSDRGAHWEERTSLGSGLGVPIRLFVDPGDPKTLYAIPPATGVGNSLFVTHDGAGSWTLLPAAAACAGYLRDIAMSSPNPSRIWISGNNGVCVSSNSGTNFSLDSPAAVLGGVAAMAINPADPRNLWVGDSYGHVYKTTDEGAVWMDITGNVTAGQVTAIAISPTQPSPHVLVGGYGGLSLNTSGGNSWTPRQTGFLGTRITGFSADATPDRLYISASTAGVHYIANGGDSTVSTDNSQLRALMVPPATFHVPAILAQGGVAGRLFASLDNRIARSLDGGSSWTLTGFPLAAAQQVSSLTSAPGNPQVILAGTYSSLFRSANSGDSWTSATTGLPAGAHVERVQFAPSDPLVAYASPQIYSATSQSFGLYRSTDAGQSWSPANTGIESLGVVAIAVDPTDAQTLYVSADSKLWRSTNGGGSWTALPWQGQFWGYPSALAVDPLHPKIIYGTGQAVVARSINRGDSWELLRESQALPTWTPSAILPDPNRPHVLLVGTQSSGAQQITIAPDLTLALAPTSNPLKVGEPITYRYTVANIGPFHATGVKLTLDVPASARDVTVAPSVGACTTSGQKINCALNDVRAGLDATVTLQATTSQLGAFPVSATVQADQPDAVVANNTQTRDTTVAQLADVFISATGPASARTGDALTYTLTASNAGPESASGVQLTYKFAAGMTAGTVSTDTGSCSVDSGVATCAIGTLAAGSKATISVHATAASVGDQNSSATLTTTSTDSVAANDTWSLVTSVTASPPAGGGSGNGGTGGGGTGGGSSGGSSTGSGGGGGGRLSPEWLFFLGLILVARLRADARRPRLSA